ncbi:MAG: right-handed parallel beta-helix repeat-containing protein, partial [Planctomycetota bacterium]
TGNADFGIQVSNSRNTRIVKNTLSSNNGGISIRGNCRDNDIRGNDILSSLNDFDGIVVGDPSDGFSPSSITIASNEIKSSYNGIKLCKVRNSAVSDNVLNGNAGHGLWLVEDPNIVIENNVIQSNSKHGIYVEDSNNFTIRENKIFGNGVDGIHLEDSSAEDSNDVSIIATNKIYGNMSDGIDIENSICNIMRNIVTDNNCLGIRLNSSGNTITYNSIMDNNSGIYVGGENNMIHHNVFVNGLGKDPNNAKAEDLPNLWDNDNEPNYIGNFWSDYLDKCPDAKQEGDDIKWNTPYPITVNDPHEPNDNRDRGPILLVSYKITKPHWLSMTMNERYNLELELTNNWAKFDPPGLDVDFAGLEQTDAQPGSWLDWVPGVEDFDWWPDLPGRPWPLNITYDNDEVPEGDRTIPALPGPDNPKKFELDFKNKWDWIKPSDWKDVVTALILTIPFPHGTELSIVSFAEACYRAALAVPSVKYIFEPHPDSSDFIILKTDVTRNVPLHKPAFLFGSLGLQIASIKYAILAAPLLPWVPTFPAGVALTVKSVLCTVGSIIAYKVAEDPDPDYKQIFEPNSIVVPEVEWLEDGDAKRLALAALELASLEHAYGQSCIRYDGAKTADPGEPDDLYGDPNDFYMALQLGAALKYSAMATRKAQEVEVLSATVTSDPCVVGRIAEFVDESYVTTFSLKQKQKKILESVLGQIGLDPTEPNVANIEYVIDQAKAIPELRQQHFNNNIDNLEKHMHIMTQTYHIQDYALLDVMEKDGLLDLYQVHYMHDVAITNVWPSVVEVDRAQKAYIEEKVYINVEVENLGTSTESFSVKVYVDPNLAEPI